MAVQVVADDGPLGAAEGLLGELADLLEHMLLRLLVQLQGGDLLPVGGQLIGLGLLALSQLVLEDPDLGAQDLLPLGADQLVPDLALHLVLEAQDVVLPGQEAVELAQADVGGELLQDLLLVGVAEADVLGDVVRQEAGVPAIHDGGEHLLRHPAGHLGVLSEEGVGLAQQGLGPGAALEGLGVRLLRDGLHIGLEIGRGLPQPLQPGPLAALHHAADGAAHPQQVGDVGHGADLIEVGLAGLGRADLPLGHQEDVLVRLHGPLQGGDGDGTLHVEGEVHMGENRQAPEGQDGDVPVALFHGWFLSWRKRTGGRAPRPFPLRFKKPTRGMRNRSAVCPLPCRCSVSRNS